MPQETTGIQITAISNAAISSGSLLSNSFDPSYEGLNSLTLPIIPASGIGNQLTATVPLQIGAIKQGAPLLESTKSFRWSMSPYAIDNPEDFSFGDIVYFSPGINDYSSILNKVNVHSVGGGENKGLFIFDSYNTESQTLKIIHKGFVDVPLGMVESYMVGNTIYIGENNKLSTTPTTASGSWVRSMGLCVPSKDSTLLRIWLDPDSTYILLV